MRARQVFLSLAFLSFTVSLPAQGVPGTAYRAVDSGTVDVSAIPFARIVQDEWQQYAVAPQEPPEHAPVTTFPVPLAPRAPTAATLPPAASFNASNSPAPALSMLALDMRLGYIPPDTNGAVGPNHLVVSLNTQISFQDRLGHELNNVPLMSFWKTQWSDLVNVWDPNLRYDPYNDRWMMACIGNYLASGASLLVGVSATGDPTGTWYLRRIYEDPANNLLSFDYPRIGFNKDWIVVSGNDYDSSGNYQYSVVYLFDKADLYANGSKTPKKWGNITNGFTLAPATTYDNSVATMYLLGDYNGNYNGTGYLSLSTITGAVGSEMLNLVVANPSTPNPWTRFIAFPANFAPQLGSTQKIDVFDARMQSCIYRNGNLWATHMVFLPATGTATRAAVDWWQIAPDGTTVQFGRIENPAGTYFYFYPSLSVNKNNDVLIGYSRSAASEYAGGAYAFRAAGDPAGTVRQEYVLKTGEGPYSLLCCGGRNRWGDYSGTTVDPVNDLDFWTVQEYAGAGNVWSTWWGKIVPPGAVTAPVPDARRRPQRPPRLPIAGGSTVKGSGITSSRTSTGTRSQIQR